MKYHRRAIFVIPFFRAPRMSQSFLTPNCLSDRWFRTEQLIKTNTARFPEYDKSPLLTSSFVIWWLSSLPITYCALERWRAKCFNESKTFMDFTPAFEPEPKSARPANSRGIYGTYEVCNSIYRERGGWCFIMLQHSTLHLRISNVIGWRRKFSSYSRPFTQFEAQPFGGF